MYHFRHRVQPDPYRTAGDIGLVLLAAAIACAILIVIVGGTGW